MVAACTCCYGQMVLSGGGRPPERAGDRSWRDGLAVGSADGSEHIAAGRDWLRLHSSATAVASDALVDRVGEASLVRRLPDAPLGAHTVPPPPPTGWHLITAVDPENIPNDEAPISPS